MASSNPESIRPGRWGVLRGRSPWEGDFRRMLASDDDAAIDSDGLLSWDPNETEKPWIRGPFFDEPRRIYIEVETQRQEKSCCLWKAEVKPTTRLGWEEDA